MDSRQELDLAVFTELSAAVQQTYTKGDADIWESSPFRWIKAESSRRIGAIGEKLVEAWARHEGFPVSGPSNSGHDRVIAGIKVEVKFSTLWAGGMFVFQQIRDQDYDVAALLALEPLRARIWFVPKAVLWEHSVGQHTGADASDTRWLRFDATALPSWLEGYGGALDSAKLSLEQARSALGRD